MAIRRKLLFLLLGMTLTPLIMISAFRQITIRLARQRLTGRIEARLVSNAGLQLQQLLTGYAEILAREAQLMDVLVRRQAREAEFRLSLAVADHTSGGEGERRKSSGYRDDATGVVSQETALVLPQEDAGPTDHDQSQAVFLTEGVEERAVASEMGRLRDMTTVYQEIQRLGPAGILRQYITLESGLYMSYPASNGQVYSQPHDPRKRPWYVQARTSNEVVHVGPVADVITGKTIVTVATSVRRLDGSLAGVTAIDRTIPDIFAGMRLPDAWASGTERVLLAADLDSDPCDPRLLVVLQSRYEDSGGDWQRPTRFSELQSSVAFQLRMMIEDVQAGRPGIRRMDYQGRSCLWVYGSPGLERIIPLLIVPYDAVVELATTISNELLQESIFWLWGSGTVLLIAITAGVLIAVARARSLTQPISDLARAGSRLAAGDYSARVHIATGDELAQLGMLFNEVGPKLREREKMRRSLELAGAIQQSLLPGWAPRLKHFELAGQCLYCDETGGDYYDFIDAMDLGPGTLGVAVGDVSGHGIGAALLMAAARSSLRANTRHHGTGLVELFRKTNHDLVRDTGDDKFLTLFYGVVDDRNRSLTWVSGGHDPALWYHADTGTIEELPNTGMLMGIFEEAVFAQGGPVFLRSGDMVVVGTDGIWEARNLDGHLFGKERLYEILRQAAGSAEDTCRAILKAVEDFIGSAPRQDDVTVVVLKTLAFEN